MNCDAAQASANRPTESGLVALAVAGDRVALEQLLLEHYDELARRIGARLPPRLQSTQAVEDILQITFFQVFRDIHRFEPRPDATFLDWLARIAENRLCDAIKQHDRPKHGGDRRRVDDATSANGSVLSLWEWIAAADTSPASIVARGEALQALQVALAALPEDQSAAIRMRFLEGKSLEETALAMNRTTDAIRGLVHRGKQELLNSMGRASRWLKSK